MWSKTGKLSTVNAPTPPERTWRYFGRTPSKRPRQCDRAAHHMSGKPGSTVPVGCADVERAREPEHLPQRADPRADRDDDLLDRHVAGARVHRRHGAAVVALEPGDRDAPHDLRAGRARLGREPEHR